jgi:hypothetical protein
LKKKKIIWLTGIVLILSGIITIICFELLRQTIDYPDFLRKGTDYILTTYTSVDSGIRLLWYGMFAGSLFIMFGILLMHNAMKFLKADLPLIVTATGAFAGLFNILGFIRWVFLVPHLSQIYNSSDVTPETQNTIKIIFEAFHTYLGISVGEHLGMMFLALWGIFLSLSILKTQFFPRWLSVIGILFSIITLTGLTEPFGYEWAAAFAAIGSSLQLVWIVIIGFYLLLKKTTMHTEADNLYAKVSATSFELIK